MDLITKTKKLRLEFNYLLPNNFILKILNRKDFQALK